MHADTCRFMQHSLNRQADLTCTAAQLPSRAQVAGTAILAAGPALLMISGALSYNTHVLDKVLPVS